LAYKSLNVRDLTYILENDPKMSYFRGCFLFYKKMVHPIVFLTSFLNSATRKNIQNDILEAETLQKK